METVTKIQTALGELVAAMSNKGVIKPRAQLHIDNGGSFTIHFDAAYDTKPFGRNNYFILFGETPVEVIDKARAYIDAMPPPEEAVQNEYLSRVASAIDYATEHSLPDKYVAPLRGLLTATHEQRAALQDNGEE